MPVINPEKLTDYLNDFECDENEKSRIIICNENEDIQGMIRLLRTHRHNTLETIHKGERQISCLDCLVFQLENKIKK